MAQKVAMVHPDLPKTSETPRIESKEGFEKSWKAQGWKLAPKADQPGTEEKK